MIGQSMPMRRIMGRIERVASSDVPVLITGETGTGKEVTARLIHDRSRRRDGPYWAVNCAAIPDTLIESELFGHERGSFTGADRRHEGFFERANHGTLLLDEFTEMRCETQAKLLRVLEDGKVLPVGGAKQIPTDVRVLAASDRPLDRLIHAGRLREDLYYRLDVCSVHLPPLRERIEDLPLLVDHFIHDTKRHGRQITGIDDECLTVLARYKWPGNVRQLKHVIEGAEILANSPTLQVHDLPPYVRACTSPESSFVVPMGSSVREVVDELIWRTVAYAGGNKAVAAKILGIGRRTVYTRLGHRDSYETDGHANGHPYHNGNGGFS